jgi:hypothetical protein
MNDPWPAGSWLVRFEERKMPHSIELASHHSTENTISANETQINLEGGMTLH